MGGLESTSLGCARTRLALAILMAADATALVCSACLSLVLRFDHLPWRVIYERYAQAHVLSLAMATVVYLAVFWLFHLYRYAWRFASLDMLWSVVYANSIGIVALIVIQRLIDGQSCPRSVLILFWASSIVLIGGVRIVLRILSIASRHGLKTLRVIRDDSALKRVVILGAGTTGARALRAIRESPQLRCEVVAFLDDDPHKQGMYIGNVKVAGPIQRVTQLADRNQIDEVIVALPESSREEVKSQVTACRTRALPVKVVARIDDQLAGARQVQLEDFGIEDLLRRKPAVTNIQEIGTYLTGKRVLVTGAGGSIGSELCRQIGRLNPASLVLLGHGENSIYGIYTQMQSELPWLAESISFAIASVVDEHRLRQVFAAHRPEVVLHAAAHKHVPIMEACEQEAVSNNVIGTYHVAMTSGEAGVEKVVAISTDKAADPCCIMGATKWLCEELLRSLATAWPRTSFISVRFGNVLGSRGSVVPLFREQIKRGGPVTVTHPEMTRYFMTIPEAVRLVLQAGAVGQSGELYLLDMGDPVRIVDLARDMIRLSGLRPDADISVEFMGLRPGEKLHERLVSASERVVKTPYEGLSIIRRSDSRSPNDVLDHVNRLASVAQRGTSEEVRQLLADVVPGLSCAPPVEEDQHETGEHRPVIQR